jgi:hypothetical protein
MWADRLQLRITTYNCSSISTDLFSKSVEDPVAVGVVHHLVAAVRLTVGPDEMG